MSELLIIGLVACGTLIIGLGAGYTVRKMSAESKISSAEEEARRIVNDAERNSEARKKEALLEAKEEIHRLRAEIEKEVKERRVEIQKSENRLEQKEENLDRKVEILEKKEETLEKKEADILTNQQKIKELELQQIHELERISNLSFDDAKKILLNTVEEEIRHETAIMIKDIEQEAKEEAAKAS